MLHRNNLRIWRGDTIFCNQQNNNRKNKLSGVFGACFTLTFQCGKWWKFGIGCTKSRDTSYNMPHVQLTWCLVLVFESDHFLIIFESVDSSKKTFLKIARKPNATIHAKPKHLFFCCILRAHHLRQIAKAACVYIMYAGNLSALHFWFSPIKHYQRLIVISSLGCTPSTYMSSSHWCLNFILRHLLHSVSDLFLIFFTCKTLNWFHSRSLRSHSFCRLGLLSHELVAPWPWVGLKWPKEKC